MALSKPVPLPAVAVTIAAFGNSRTVASPDRAAEVERMNRLRLGDATALEELIHGYWASLAEYAGRLLDDADAGKDVAQAVFVRLWQQRADWSPTGSLGSYLFRIARNLVIDEQRRRRVRSAWASAEQRRPRGSPPTPAEVLAGEELRAAVAHAVQQLPARRREVFVLAHVNGLSYREIAQVMGISPQTAANQLAIAVSDLLRALHLE